MSRLGKQPVQIPGGVTVTAHNNVLTVKGPKGELSRDMVPEIEITVEGETVTLVKAKDNLKAKALWGTYAAHLRNMILGVTEGYTRVLEIEGVGYKADAQGNKIKFALGFSHPIELEVPAGIQAATEKGVITLTGIDKDAIGQFAANIRKLKKPEPYKGKGIRYRGEFIIRKQGKKGAA